MKTATASGEARRRRILICDDERHILRLLQVNLERQGYTVTCASTGLEAVGLLGRLEGGEQSRGFDLAVVDYQMPGLDGYEVLKWIREHDHTRSMKVALLISRSEEGDALRAMPYRAEVYITKPFGSFEWLP